MSHVQIHQSYQNTYIYIPAYIQKHTYRHRHTHGDRQIQKRQRKRGIDKHTYIQADGVDRQREVEKEGETETEVGGERETVAE